jgi:proline dehydrogenase
VRIDMESSEYVDRALTFFSGYYEKFKNVGTVLQAYLYRTRDDLERLLEMGARIRLVKGAYLEPPEVAFQSKGDVDANFVRLMELMLSRGNYPAIATHDTVMIASTVDFTCRRKIDRSSFEFQMLYGIRRDLQTRLVRDGYHMRVYVPFGTHWYPYLMRRMAERPANVAFVTGSILREAVSRHG